MKKIFLASLAILALFSATYACGSDLGKAEAISLFADGGNGRNMFVDRRASQIGDILTIVINERTTTSATKSTTNSKSGEQTLLAGMGIFRGIMGGSASQEDSFQADGAASNTNRFSGNITVTVVDVQENGNLVIEGKQSIWQNKNEEKITITGIVRPDDIAYNNTVPSNKVSDATIKFDGKGPLNAKQRQGIITQILNFLF